jgi:hypothetical protein
MPQTIDEEKLATMQVLDLSKPQGYAQGLPVKQIPIVEYPRCIYKHPAEPYREMLHRNVNHEVVHRELVATEHKVHIVENKDEHKKKLAEGWTDEPYIPQAAPDPDEHLYSKVTDEVVKRIGKNRTQKDGKPQTGSELDLVEAQKFLRSRGYECSKPEDASDFVKALTPVEQAAFVKELAEFVAAEGDGK